MEKTIKPFEIGKETIKPFVIAKGVIKPFVIEKERVKPFEIGSISELDLQVLEKTKTVQKQITEERGREAGKENKLELETISPNTSAETDKTKEEEFARASVANYELYPLVKNIYINREGAQIKEREKFCVRVCVDGQMPEEIDVLTSEIKGIANIIGKRFSTAMLDVEEKKADKYVEQKFRRRTVGVPVIRNYVDPGWQMIDGKWVYLSDSYVGQNSMRLETGMSLPFYKCNNEEIGKIAMRAMTLYGEQMTMASMFLFAFTGITFRLFEQAGYVPRFVLFMNGKTGSMKTTIAKILFVQLCEEKYRNLVRRIDSDTIVSFERAVVKKGVDTVLLFDDYAPAKTPQKKMEMQNKLESIIRMVGDGSTKSRSNVQLEDIQGEGVHGTLVITGEVRGNGLSSNLRCLYAELKRELVNVETVSWFQEHPYAFTTLIAYFSEYLSVNWDSVLNYIKGQFAQKRKEIEGEVGERRLVDSVVTLHIISQILQEFLTDWCACERGYVEDIFAQMRTAVTMNAKYSQEISTEETPALMFVKVVADLIKTKQLRLCEKQSYMVAAGYDGFEEGNFIYLVPEITYEEVQRVFAMTHHYYPLNLNETVVALCEEGMIKAYSNGIGKRTYYARVPVDTGKKQKFLKLSKNMFEKIDEDYM